VENQVCCCVNKRGLEILTHIHVLWCTVVFISSCADCTIDVVYYVCSRCNWRTDLAANLTQQASPNVWDAGGEGGDAEIHGDGSQAAPDHVGVTKCRGRLPHMHAPSY